jgi:EmrB/QacA subfamily drug resistance transporter
MKEAALAARLIKGAARPLFPPTMKAAVLPPAKADLTTSYTPGQVLPFRESLLAMVGISLVNLLAALDQTVVSTAMPSIVSELKGFEYYAWIVTSYLLASVVTVPVFGRLGDYFGRKPFVIAAITTFTAASVLCGLAPSMMTLLFARALQGVGGGMMVGTAFAAIPDLFPDSHSRVKWQVVMAAAYGIGTAAGPSLGGFLSQHYTWRSTFMINLPVGIVSLICVILYLPAFRPAHDKKIQIDWGGALLISTALGCLQLCVELLPKNGWNFVTALLLLAVVSSSAAFLWCEKRATHPIVPLALFGDGSLNVVFLLSVLIGFIMFSLVFFSPLLLQAGFGLSPQRAGLLVTPLAACVAVGSIFNSRIVTRLSNPTVVVSLGFALLVLSCLGICITGSNTPHWLLELPLFAGGIGMGFIFSNLNVFSQELAGRENFGIVTAVIQSTRMVGGMLGTAIIGMFVTRFYAARVPSAVATSLKHIPDSLLTQMQDPQALVDRQAEAHILAQLSQVTTHGSAVLDVMRQSLVNSIHLGFLVTAIAAAIAVWKVRSIAHLRLRRVHQDSTLAIDEEQMTATIR